MKLRAFDPSKPELGFIYYDLDFLALMIGGSPDMMSGGAFDSYCRALDIQRLFQRTVPTRAMAFTEMKDKEGVEIYEGDIVQTLQGLSEEVKRGPGGFYLGGDLPFTAFKPHELKVVGNICQDKRMHVTSGEGRG